VLVLCTRFETLEANRATIEDEARKVGAEVAKGVEEEARAAAAAVAAAAAEAAQVLRLVECQFLHKAVNLGRISG